MSKYGMEECGRNNRALWKRDGMAVSGAILLTLGLPLFSFAEEPAGLPPAEAVAPPPPAEAATPARSAAELQQDLLAVRGQYVQARRELLQFQAGVDAGAGQALLSETAQLRQEIRRLEQEAANSPENAETFAEQARQVRQTLYAKEAQRTALLNQSEEYRTLSAKEGELQEQLKDILQKIQDAPAEPSGAVAE